MVETKKLGVKELADLANSKSIWFPSAEIYSGNLAGFWDFGPYGESIRRKVIDFWRKELVQKEECIVRR